MRFLLALLALFSLGACDKPAPATPPGSPRVVALSPAIAVIVNDLGHAGLVVGRHAYDASLDPAIPVCGDQAAIDYETLLRVRPTLVLTQWGTRALPEALVRQGKARGYEIADYRLLTLDDIAGTVRDIDRRLRPANTPPTAACDVLTDRMNKAWSPRPILAKAGRVLLLAAVSPPASTGPGSFNYQVLQRIGATPAITEGGAYIILDAEDIIRIAPDAIVLIDPRGRDAPPSRRDPRAALGPIAALDTPAARTNRFAVIDDPGALTPATTMIRFADDLADTLSKWAERP